MSTSIKVLLRQDVENLGASGDIVKVRSGYARNFLVPRGLALVASAGNIARVGDIKKAAATRAVRELELAVELAKKLEATAIKLARAVGGDKRMYGSVTAKDIAEAFAALGLEFDRRTIELAEPIKTLGLSEVRVRLHREVSATLRVEVVMTT